MIFLHDYGDTDANRKYERAAIKTARSVFPRATIEGCGFHLARARNRRRDHVGVRKFIRGNMATRAVCQNLGEVECENATDC